MELKNTNVALATNSKITIIKTKIKNNAEKGYSYNTQLHKCIKAHLKSAAWHEVIKLNLNINLKT